MGFGVSLGEGGFGLVFLCVYVCFLFGFFFLMNFLGVFGLVFYVVVVGLFIVVLCFCFFFCLVLISHSESLLLKGRIHSWVAEYDPAGLTGLLLLLSGRRTLCRRRWLPGEEAGSLTAVCLEPAPDSRLLPMVPSAFRAPQSYVLCICHYSKFGQIWTVEERSDLGHFEDLLLIQLRNTVLYDKKRPSFHHIFHHIFFSHFFPTAPNLSLYLY